MEIGRFQDALDQLEKSPQSYADVHFYKALSYWKTGQFSNALDALKKAIGVDEKYAEAHFYYGYILVDSCIQKPAMPELPSPIERLKQSERYFENAVSNSESIDGETVEKGVEKARDSNFEKGLEILEQAIPKGRSETNRPWDSELFLRFMYKNAKDITRILHQLERLVEQNPKYPDLRHALGSAYLIRAWYCFSKATDQFKNAIEINPDFEKAANKVKLLQNDGRGLLILLRAVLK
ncbi:MAG: hypothetical protein U5R06_17400 [candidate division KSB1 bacterium]|nr:hypothetical protein [candidate division KSB1 bacterium]